MKANFITLFLHKETRTLNPVHRAVVRLGQFVLKVIIKFFQDRCFPRSAGLSYSTILAIVPLMAVFLGFGGNLFNIDETLQEFLANTFLPTSQDVILKALNDFTENSRKLGFWGLMIFLFTAVMLLHKIENQFNQVFRSRPNTNILFRLAVYTSSLVLGSLFIGASLSFTSNFITMFHFVSQDFFNPFLIRLAVSSISVFFMIMLLLLLIYLLPTAKIKLGSALLGATTGAILFELAKKGFSIWAKFSVRFSVIFGSLFLIPILLIWIFIIWLIILLALQTTFVHQHKDLPVSSAGNLNIEAPYHWIITGCSIYLFICQRFHNKEVPPGFNEISNSFSLPERSITQILNLFEDQQLVYQIQGKGKGYVPVSDLSQITLNSLVDILIGRNTPWKKAQGNDSVKTAYNAVQNYFKAGEEVFDGKNILDLIEVKD